MGKARDLRKRALKRGEDPETAEISKRQRRHSAEIAPKSAEIASKSAEIAPNSAENAPNSPEKPSETAISAPAAPKNASKPAKSAKKASKKAPKPPKTDPKPPKTDSKSPKSPESNVISAHNDADGTENPEIESNTAQKAALAYLTHFKHSRENPAEKFKFNKTRQVFLLKNAFEKALIPAEYFAIMLKYLENIAGNARENLLKNAKNRVKCYEDRKNSGADSYSGPMVGKGEYKRALEVARVLDE
eukprot:TRINITY_DN1934_c1_g1_i4.p1 TRINITY_DN1934_c1_g1~~TRINITY_DN1934_c1_g1_i4.p1  ORF type:complete len:279 (-),score=39.22 TRINITY_DN1934_c1_g1_i4:214-951(-)